MASLQTRFIQNCDFFKQQVSLFLITLTATTIISLTPTQVSAQTVAVPVGSQGNHAIETPNLGMSMEYVREHYGQPEREQGPVGTPPITIWYYGQYRVYFEYSTVIHTVLTHNQTK